MAELRPRARERLEHLAETAGSADLVLGPALRDGEHAAIGYVTPRDKLLGLETEIWPERDRKLEQARELRRKRRPARS